MAIVFKSFDQSTNFFAETLLWHQGVNTFPAPSLISSVGPPGHSQSFVLSLNYLLEN